MRQEARPPSVGGVDVHVPDYLAEVIATISHLARASTHVNQRSGVSVRLSVTNYEVARGQRPAPRPAGGRARRRAARRRPRGAGRQLRAARSRSSRSTRAARARSSRTSSRAPCSPCSRSASPPEQTRDVDRRVRGGRRSPTPARTSPSSELAALVEPVPALRAPVAALTGGDESPAAVAAAVDVRARGPAPVEAPEQGHLRHPRHLPQPQLTRLSPSGRPNGRLEGRTVQMNGERVQSSPVSLRSGALGDAGELEHLDRAGEAGAARRAVRRRR